MIWMIADIVVTVITIPLWIFQTSVLIFLLYFYFKKYQLFSSTVFTLFILLEITNFFNELSIFLMRRLSFVPFVQPFFLSSTVFSSILYAGSAYTLYTMCFLRVTIAINQLYNVQTLLTHKSTTLQKYGRMAIPVVPFIGIPLLFRRFFYPAPFFQHSDGSLFIGYLDPDIQKYQSFVSAIVLVTTTLLAFFISMITILKYRALSRKTDLSAFKVKKMRYEHRLLWQSMLVLFIQILLCSTQVPLYVATRIHSNDLLAVSKVIYSYCDDAFGLVNSITLIVISRNTRQNYVTFWKGIWSNKIQMASTTRIETMRSVSKIQAT